MRSNEGGMLPLCVFFFALNLYPQHLGYPCCDFSQPVKSAAIAQYISSALKDVVVICTFRCHLEPCLWELSIFRIASVMCKSPAKDPTYHSSGEKKKKKKETGLPILIQPETVFLLSPRPYCEPAHRVEHHVVVRNYFTIPFQDGC